MKYFSTKNLGLFNLVIMVLSMTIFSCKKDSPAPPSAPKITTADISSFDEISAQAGGEVTSDGGSSITERGIVWGTTPSPEINGNGITKLADADKTVGAYQISITGLKPATKYYLRSYSINAIGTSYGNEVSFTSKSIIVPNGLLAFYKFDAETKDHSGNGNDIMASNVLWGVADNSANGQTAVFDGTSSTASSTIDFGGSTSASISAWISSGPNNNPASTIYFASMSDLGLAEIDGGYIGLVTCNPCNMAYSNSWMSAWTTHHLVGTYDGTTIKFYFDGTLQQSVSNPTGSSYGSQTLTLGNMNSTFWQGSIDNLKIYNRELTASEVTQLYNE